MTDARLRALVFDAICFISFAALIVMSIKSYYFTDRLKYQLYTGIFSGLICLLPLFLRRFNLVYLPFPLLILVELSIFLHGYGVLLMQYDNIVWYDSITHTLSSITVGMCVFYALLGIDSADSKVHFGKNGILLYIMLIMLTFSIYWEVFELFVDLLTGTNMQYSPFDTMRDMISNTVGGFVASMYGRYFLGKNPDYDLMEEFGLHPAIRKILANHH
ncbi:MAG: hypothetical protein ACOX8L_05455 [Candidatus Methanomethylophilaceae archaeon]